jgi:hypothetical protein
MLLINKICNNESWEKMPISDNVLHSHNAYPKIAAR